MSPAEDRYAVLRIRDFRLALLTRVFDSLGNQMLGLAVAWQVYQLTHAPLPLGLIGLAEGLPFMAAALWAGHLADTGEKRRLIAGGEAGVLAGAVGFALLALSPRPPLALIYACMAWGGFCRSFMWASMSTYIQLAVPKELFPKAAAWSTGVLHGATIAGPALGGLIYDLWGAEACYRAVAACFLMAAWCATRMSPMAARPGGEARGLASFLSGARFVRGTPVMLAAMSLDMFGVLFGGVEGVLPIFAAMLGASSTGLGVLQAAGAGGAFLMSLVLAHHQPFRQTGRTFVSCVTVFGLCMIAFAFSRSFWLSAAILAAAGAVDCVGMVLRSSIYQALTPDHLRGRVSSVNGIFIRTSNEIGVFESGLAARLLGLVPSVVFGGCMTLVSVGAALALAPELPRYRLDEG